MKRTHLLATVLAVIVSVSACKPEEEQKIPDLTLERTEVTVPAEGGNFSVKYTIENPLADVELRSECTETWIGPFDTSVSETITFSVEPNAEEAERTAVVDVIYGDIVENFTVVQAGTGTVAPADALDLNIERVGMTDVAWTVLPADTEMPYISMTVDKRVYDQLGSDEAYLEEDLQIFNLMAGSSGMSLEDYLAQMVTYGERSYYRDGLTPGLAYYVYAYGISLDGTALTGIFKEEIITETPEQVDITFEIVCEPGLDNVTVQVTPSLTDQMYIVDVLEKDGIMTSTTLEEQYVRIFNEKISDAQAEGMTKEEAVKSLSKTGNASVLFENLYANTEYVALAMAVNEDGLFVSEATTEEFVTEEVTSDNVITVEITDVQADRVSYSITTTNDDPYVMYYIQASMWEDWEDEDIIRNLIEYYDVDKYNIYNGDRQGELTGLMTKTQYVMYTFGCESGVATTPLGKTFFTPESGSTDITFNLVYDKYFDGDDLIAAYPDEESYKQYAGKAVLPVKAEVSDPTATYYYYVYSSDYSEYGDDVLYSSLANGTGLSVPSYVFSRNFGRTCTIAGFAVDAEGNYGPLFRANIEFTYDGASPISEFEPDMLQ